VVEWITPFIIGIFVGCLVDPWLRAWIVRNDWARQERQLQAQERHAQEPHAQEPHAQEPHAQEPHAQEPHAQEQHAQEPHAQEQHAQEQHAQEQHAQEPVPTISRRVSWSEQESAVDKPAPSGSHAALGGDPA
jgi:hypothetical protein